MLPRKNVLDFNPRSKQPFPGLSSFRTGYWPGFKIKARKISFLKSYPFFKSLTVLRKTVETGLDPRLLSCFFWFMFILSAIAESKY